MDEYIITDVINEDLRNKILEISLDIYIAVAVCRILLTVIEEKAGFTREFDKTSLAVLLLRHLSSLNNNCNTLEVMLNI